MSNNKMISFLVDSNYHNEKLDTIMEKNDTVINEQIINYGILIYESVKKSNEQIDKNITLENYEIARIKEEIKATLEANYKINSELLENKNYENIILKNDCQKLQEQIQTLNQNIELLSNEKYNSVCSFLEKGKQLAKDEYQITLNMQIEQRGKLEQDLQNKDQIINQLQQQIFITSKDREDKTINTIDKTINALDKTIDCKFNTIDCNINQLNQKFTDYFQKIFTNNTEKGEYGEEFVQNYLIDKFSGSMIADTHKETASGDILFHFNNLKTLIEVKNVQQVKPTEVEKFYRDIQQKKDEINSALFISLNDTNLIKGQKIIHFEIKYGVPIFMISNAFNKPENIRLAIIIIQYLINHNFILDTTKSENTQSKDIENKQILQLLITAINEVFEYVHLQRTNLSNDLLLLQKMQDSFKKRDSQINNIDIVINGIFRQYPQLYIHKSTHTTEKEPTPIDIETNGNLAIINNEMKKIINLIIEHIQKNNLTSFNHTMINIKLLKHLLISDGAIRNLGGIKNIKIAYNTLNKLNLTNAPLEINENQNIQPAI
jgi:hypothetical protein